MCFLWLNFIVWTVSALLVAMAAAGSKVALVAVNPVLIAVLYLAIFGMALRSAYRLGHEFGRRRAGGAPSTWWAGPPFGQILQAVSAVLGIASFVIQVLPKE